MGIGYSFEENILIFGFVIALVEYWCLAMPRANPWRIVIWRFCSLYFHVIQKGDFQIHDRN